MTIYRWSKKKKEFMDAKYARRKALHKRKRREDE